MLRRRNLVLLAALILLGAASVSLIAFVIVPQLVRSTLVEELPVAPVGSSGASAAAASATLVSGELVRISAADYGTGTIRILRVGDARVLRFENVDIAGAPDVYVYLSDRTDGMPGRFVDLGRLKATNGSFNYSIPDGTDLGTIRSVVLWFRQFSVTVDYATLRLGRVLESPIYPQRAALGSRPPTGRTHFTEAHVPDVPVLVDEGEGRPVAVAVSVPGRELRVEGDREGEALVAVVLVPGLHIRLHLLAVDASEGPEVRARRTRGASGRRGGARRQTRR